MWRVRREIEFSRFVLRYHHMLYIPTTSTFFRRRIFDEGNWIDLCYQYAMDYEFFLRLSDAGYRFQHIPGLPLRVVRKCAHALAAALRYSEKLRCGYYFDQLRPRIARARRNLDIIACHIWHASHPQTSRTFGGIA